MTWQPLGRHCHATQAALTPPGLQLAKGNDIEDEGALALCEALSKREAPLEVLDLGGNRWGHSIRVA